LIVSSPTVAVKGVAADWWGNLPDSPSLAGHTEDRYASHIEFKEVSDLTKSSGLLRSTSTSDTYPGQGKTSIFVFHHAAVSARRPASASTSDQEGSQRVSLSTHEVGRN